MDVFLRSHTRLESVKIILRGEIAERLIEIFLCECLRNDRLQFTKLTLLVKARDVM
jgi:hypothetical protein